MLKNNFLNKGFSLGDELGFPESLGNEEGSRKRSLNVRNNDNTMIAAGQPFMVIILVYDLIGLKHVQF
jgi:hypothetical protein